MENVKIICKTNDVCIETMYDLTMNNVNIITTTGEGRVIKLRGEAKHVWNNVSACGFDSDLHTSANASDNSLYCNDCIMSVYKHDKNIATTNNTECPSKYIIQIKASIPFPAYESFRGL